MQRVVDVGGGYGALLAAILTAHPGVRGVLFDLPQAIEGARTHLSNAGLADRCELIAGDFFESLPNGADAYLLKAVLHDWDDQKSRAILLNCRRAIPLNGKLLLIEQIVPDRFEACSLHHAIAWADLTMLVEFGGRERTLREFRDLLEIIRIQINQRYRDVSRIQRSRRHSLLANYFHHKGSLASGPFIRLAHGLATR